MNRKRFAPLLATTAALSSAHAEPVEVADRLDGFVSLQTGAKGGEVVTKPLIWKGKSLEVNGAVNKGGSLKRELQDSHGKVLPGFALADCDSFVGDDAAAKISWSGKGDLSVLSGENIRVRFALSDGDLYSMRFR